jgi:hypothetical protein
MSTVVSGRSVSRSLRVTVPFSLAIAFTVIGLDPARAAAEHALAQRNSMAVTPPSASSPVALRLPAAVPYLDCTGVTPLSRTTVYRDTCLPGVYLVGHNPGVFTTLLSLRVGSEVSYKGRTYTIRSVALRTPSTQWAEAQAHPAVLTLQTCVNDAAGSVWVLTAS